MKSGCDHLVDRYLRVGYDDFSLFASHCCGVLTKMKMKFCVVKMYKLMQDSLNTLAACLTE